VSPTGGPHPGARGKPESREAEPVGFGLDKGREGGRRHEKID